MKKYTHFDNEITGATHYDNQPFFDFNLKRDWLQILAVATILAVCGIIYLVAF